MSSRTFWDSSNPVNDWNYRECLKQILYELVVPDEKQGRNQGVLGSSRSDSGNDTVTLPRGVFGNFGVILDLES